MRIALGAVDLTTRMIFLPGGTVVAVVLVVEDVVSVVLIVVGVGALVTRVRGGLSRMTGLGADDIAACGCTVPETCDTLRTTCTYFAGG